MPSLPTYRVEQEQVDELRDTLDALDENLRCARRCMEKLTDLRAGFTLRPVHERDREE